MPATRRTPKPIKGFAATRSSRGIIKRAAADLEQGKADTDCRRPDGSSRKDCPTPARRRGG
jgi:hypothetical protein